jgi:hypothetical protein
MCRHFDMMRIFFLYSGILGRNWGLDKASVPSLQAFSIHSTRNNTLRYSSSSPIDRSDLITPPPRIRIPAVSNSRGGERPWILYLYFPAFCGRIPIGPLRAEEKAWQYGSRLVLVLAHVKCSEPCCGFDVSSWRGRTKREATPTRCACAWKQRNGIEPSRALLLCRSQELISRISGM